MTGGNNGPIVESKKRGPGVLLIHLRREGRRTLRAFGQWTGRPFFPAEPGLTIFPEASGPDAR